MNRMVTVEVKYFKPSGKLYSSDTYQTPYRPVYEIFEEFRENLKKGIRPGLVDGHSGFTAYVDFIDHPEGYPAIFIGEA